MFFRGSPGSYVASFGLGMASSLTSPEHAPTCTSSLSHSALPSSKRASTVGNARPACSTSSSTHALNCGNGLQLSVSALLKPSPSKKKVFTPPGGDGLGAVVTSALSTVTAKVSTPFRLPSPSSNCPRVSSTRSFTAPLCPQPSVAFAFPSFLRPAVTRSPTFVVPPGNCLAVWSGSTAHVGATKKTVCSL